MPNTPPKKVRFVREVLLTSLPAFILAELFFALLYYLIVNATQMIQLLSSSFSTATVEANMEIFSPLNISIFVTALIAVSIVTCIEMATIIAITLYDYHRDDHIPLRTLLAFAFSRIRTLATWRAFPLFLIVMLLPKEHIGPQGLLSLQIPPFITDEIGKNPTYVWLALALLLVLLYYIYRLIFLIHIVLLENVTFWQAMKRSYALTKQIGILKMGVVLLRTVLWTILVTLPILFVLSAIPLFITSTTPLALLVVTMFSWLTDFFAVSLPGVMLLASLTLTYITHSGLSKSDFEKQFHLIATRPETPRWHNVRTIFHKKILLLSVVGLFILLPFFLIRLVDIEPANPKMLSLIAHRGYLYSGSTLLVENTLSAFENAHKNGADRVELDVYENADGTLVVSHDPNLKRVAGVDRAVADMSDADIRAVRLAGWEHIPTLEEVFILAKKEHIQLLVEPKLHGKERHLYQTLALLYEKYDMYDSAWVHSLSLPTLLEIRKVSPRIRIGYTVFGGIGNLGAIPVDFFSLQETVASPRLVKLIHAADKPVYIWTVNTTDNVERYMRMGVDGFITDELTTLRAEMASLVADEKKNPRVIVRILGYELPIGIPFLEGKRAK